MQTSQAPRQLDSHPLEKLKGDVVERVIHNLLLQSQEVGRLLVEAENALLVIDLCGDGREDIGPTILQSPH